MTLRDELKRDRENAMARLDSTLEEWEERGEVPSVTEYDRTTATLAEARRLNAELKTRGYCTEFWHDCSSALARYGQAVKQYEPMDVTLRNLGRPTIAERLKGDTTKPSRKTRREYRRPATHRADKVAWLEARGLLTRHDGAMVRNTSSPSLGIRGVAMYEEETMVDDLADLVAAYGPRKTRTAIHEAGHALTAWAGGGVVHELTLDPAPEENANGMCSWSPGENSLDSLRAVTAHAGVAFEREAGRRLPAIARTNEEHGYQLSDLSNIVDGRLRVDRIHGDDSTEAERAASSGVTARDFACANLNNAIDLARELLEKVTIGESELKAHQDRFTHALA